MDGPDCHPRVEVLAIDVHIRLVLVQSGCLIAAAVVGIPRSLDLAEYAV
jgi:hypothetical protein